MVHHAGGTGTDIDVRAAVIGVVASDSRVAGEVQFTVAAIATNREPAMYIQHGRATKDVGADHRGGAGSTLGNEILIVNVDDAAALNERADAAATDEELAATGEVDRAGGHDAVTGATVATEHEPVVGVKSAPTHGQGADAIIPLAEPGFIVDVVDCAAVKGEHTCADSEIALSGHEAGVAIITRIINPIVDFQAAKALFPDLGAARDIHHAVAQSIVTDGTTGADSQPQPIAAVRITSVVGGTRLQIRARGAAALSRQRIAVSPNGVAGLDEDNIV